MKSPYSSQCGISNTSLTPRHINLERGLDINGDSTTSGTIDLTNNKSLIVSDTLGQTNNKFY